MVSRRSFLAGVSAACLASWQRLNAAIGGLGKLTVGRSQSAAPAPATSTRIGNFYYQAPNGLAFIQDDAAAFVINPGGPYNAGTVAPDDSFHKSHLQCAKKAFESKRNAVSEMVAGPPESAYRG